MKSIHSAIIDIKLQRIQGLLNKHKNRRRQEAKQHHKADIYIERHIVLDAERVTRIWSGCL